MHFRKICTWWPEMIVCKSLLEGFSPAMQSLWREPLELPPLPSLSQSLPSVFDFFWCFLILFSIRYSSEASSRPGGDESLRVANWADDDVPNNLWRCWVFRAYFRENMKHWFFDSFGNNYWFANNENILEYLEIFFFWPSFLIQFMCHYQKRRKSSISLPFFFM